MNIRQVFTKGRFSGSPQRNIAAQKRIKSGTVEKGKLRHKDCAQFRLYTHNLAKQLARTTTDDGLMHRQGKSHMQKGRLRQRRFQLASTKHAEGATAPTSCVAHPAHKPWSVIEKTMCGLDVAQPQAEQRLYKAHGITGMRKIQHASICEQRCVYARRPKNKKRRCYSHKALRGQNNKQRIMAHARATEKQRVRYAKSEKKLRRTSGV